MKRFTAIYIVLVVLSLSLLACLTKPNIKIGTIEEMIVFSDNGNEGKEIENKTNETEEPTRGVKVVQIAGSVLSIRVLIRLEDDVKLELYSNDRDIIAKMLTFKIGERIRIAEFRSGDSIEYRLNNEFGFQLQPILE